MDILEPATTPPPSRPTEQDTPLLAFALTTELTIRDLYDQAIGSGSFDETTTVTMTAIRDSHGAYSQSLSALLGRVAPTSPDTDLFDKLKGDVTGDTTALANALAQIENVAVATHTKLVSSLLGVEGAALLASILIVEARHATVLQTLGGATSLADQLVGDADPLVPPAN